MDDVRKIAEGLSKAQREALVNAFVVQGQASYRNGRLATRAHGKVLYNLRLARLLNDYIGTPLLSEDGLAVRAYLKGQGHG